MLSENMALFAARGAASPSPVQELSSMIRPSAAPAVDVDRAESAPVNAKPQGGSLAGLIRRRGPVRYKPEEVSDNLIDTIVAKHLAKGSFDLKLRKHSINLEKATAASTMLDDSQCRTLRTPEPVADVDTQVAKVDTPSVEPTFVEASPAVVPCSDDVTKKAKRRQLTVRLEMEEFKKLDAIAQETDQTYQALQSKAIRQFLADAD